MTCEVKLNFSSLYKFTLLNHENRGLNRWLLATIIRGHDSNQFESQHVTFYAERPMSPR